jgi:hypothetical protein
MYRRENPCAVLATALCLMALGGSAAAATFTTFSVPGAVETFPNSINASGSITGYYEDSAGLHGFVRAADGTITTFNQKQHSTEGYIINRRGIIGGVWFDHSGVHGLLRTAHDGHQPHRHDCRLLLRQQ